MQDKPTARELVEAVAQFLNVEVAPTLGDARLRFRALVAVNVLNVVARELEMGEAQAGREFERLAEILGEADQSAAADLHGEVERLTRELAAKIRAGEADEGAFRKAALAHVEQTVVEKLEIANPRYLERTIRGRT